MKTLIPALLAIMIGAAICACGGKAEDAGHTHSTGEGHEEGGHDGDGEGHAEHGEERHAEHVTVDPATAQELGIRTAAVAAGVVRDAHEVQGLLTPIEGRHARVRARFPGAIQAVRVSVGDTVKAGQVLAVIESNVSLEPYSVSAPFAGTILDVAAGVGDLAAEEPLFELAQLSTLWVDMHLFGRDAQHITRGLAVEVTRLSDGVTTTTTLDRILPGTATASQSTVARATIQNADGQWRPGAAVRARVTVSERQAALVVPVGALQAYQGNTVVFVRSGDEYAPRVVKIGDRDVANAEVLDGLEAGEEVVVEQSYLIKADLEKESAGHEH
jgi:cobalt-zinc-cadmium efflux system membrane fusion protein